MGENKTVQILLVEDNPGDARLVKEALGEETSLAFNLIWVDRLSKGLEVLGQNNIDVVLLDLSLPDSSGLATFEKVRANAPHAPIILLTSTDDQAMADRLVHEGAQDYLIKGQVDHRLLVRSIRYAIEREQLVGILQEKEARFRRLAENAPDMIFRYEYVPRPGFTYVNPACTAITGYTPEEYYADPDLDLKIVHPDDRPLLMTVAHNAVASVVRVHLRWVHKDGSLVWTEHRNVYVLDEAGNSVAIEGIVFDITERKQAEDALRESEAKYRTVVENIPQKIFMKGRDLKFLSANENFARDLGIRPADIVGKTDYDFCPKDLADTYKIEDLRIMQTGQTEEFEGKYLLGGSDTWVQTIKSPVRDANGEIVALLGIFWDISERKQAEIQLNEQLNELRRWYQTTLGRESRVLDLKREVNELLVKASQPVRYPSTETEKK